MSIFTEEERKGYNEQSIFVGALLGGPLVAGYMMAENYKAVDKDENVMLTWVFALAYIVFQTIASYYIRSIINFPGITVAFISAFIIILIAKTVQGNEIYQLKMGDNRIQGWGHTAVVSIIGMILVFTIFFLTELLFITILG